MVRLFSAHRAARLEIVIRRGSYDLDVASPRKVTVTLEIVTNDQSLRGSAEEVPLDVEQAASILPPLAEALHGLDQGGWVIESATASETDSIAETRAHVTLCKDFVRASPRYVSDDVRACGVTDDLSPVFAWSADMGDDDDGCWDSYQGEL